jgi:hypothetical protein
VERAGFETLQPHRVAVEVCFKQFREALRLLDASKRE